MNFDNFQKQIKDILSVELPDGSRVFREGCALAREITLGRTLFMETMGVDSEEEFKRCSIKENRIMYHAHIGLNSWNATVDALKYIYNTGKSSDIEIDRAGICLDRRMGLPPAYRSKAPAETGPVLEKPEDWQQVGQAAPVQPHMGDFIIGFPAGTENTVNALKAGVTTIGNLSQFFAHQAPMWDNHVLTAVETVKAIGVLSAFRSKGVMLHSYLEDGYGALFSDCATIAGWALLERYIVEGLLKTKLSHCIGGLTTDPVKRAGWIFAFKEIHDNDCIGSMIYGDTISFTGDFNVNRAITGEYLMWDIMAQLVCPTGHAVLPLPVTESCRIPSAEEILEAQVFGRQVEKTARRLYPYVDFSEAKNFAHKIVSAGKTVYQNALDGLKSAGVDIKDPLELIYVLKQIGPAVFEKMFGAGKLDRNSIHGRLPVCLTDIFKASDSCLKTYRPLLSNIKQNNIFKVKKLLLASTDVHEHAIIIINQLLKEMGMETIYLGAEKSPGQVANAAAEKNVDSILISTHNGMARDYADRLKKNLADLKVNVPVIIGGVLNQKVTHQELPVNVVDDLKKLGFFPAVKLEGHLQHLLTEKPE